MSDELVKVTVDGKEVSVPKGTNLIQAAKSVDVEVPFYCYHPHLSVPGNCRMCQVEVEGAPKLMIGCHTQVQDGMVIKTHNTSDAVKDAQASTLEMILINHPLDCTVCDQAGHCKLQDYHYEYNARPSRFLETKENKPKAVPLGETVMLDAERCIACTRCIRFCDEVTETGEIGLVNRGDRVTIAVKEGYELSNELSGTVVDLCPVGALTHKQWRFNTRIWYTNSTDSVCTGCSTGCNVKVFERDGQVVQVKARENAEVNKEWMCDEGRYGFHRFLPEKRVTSALLKTDGELQPSDLDSVQKLFGGLLKENALVLVAPDLLLEEYALLSAFREKVAPNATYSLAYTERELNEVQKVLVSPDYAPNFAGATFARFCEGDLQSQYKNAIAKLKSGGFDTALFVGDRSVAAEDSTEELFSALEKIRSVGIFTDLESELTNSVNGVLPGRSILEKSGLLVNRKGRLQYNAQVVPYPDGTDPEWRVLGQIAKVLGHDIVNARADRDLTLSYLAAEPRLAGLTISKIKKGGVCTESYKPESSSESTQEVRS